MHAAQIRLGVTLLRAVFVIIVVVGCAVYIPPARAQESSETPADIIVSDPVLVDSSVDPGVNGEPISTLDQEVQTVVASTSIASTTAPDEGASSVNLDSSSVPEEPAVPDAAGTSSPFSWWHSHLSFFFEDATATVSTTTEQSFWDFLRRRWSLAPLSEASSTELSVSTSTPSFLERLFTLWKVQDQEDPMATSTEPLAPIVPTRPERTIPGTVAGIVTAVSRTSISISKASLNEANGHEAPSGASRTFDITEATGMHGPRNGQTPRVGDFVTITSIGARTSDIRIIIHKAGTDPL